MVSLGVVLIVRVLLTVETVLNFDLGLSVEEITSAGLKAPVGFNS